MTLITEEQMKDIISKINAVKFPMTADLPLIMDNHIKESVKEKQINEYICSYKFYQIFNRLNNIAPCPKICDFLVKNNMNQDYDKLLKRFFRLEDVKFCIKNGCPYYDEFILKNNIGNLFDYNGNAVLCYPDDNCYITSDNRKIRAILLKNQIFSNPCVKNTEDIISTVVKDILKKTNVKKINRTLVPHIAFAKIIILETINNITCENLLADNYEKISKNKINENFEKIGLKCIPIRWANVDDLEESEFISFNDIKKSFKNAEPCKQCIINYINLIKILYLITDGKKEILDDLAKLFAVIICGRALSKELGYNNLSIITTNNIRFVKEFLLSALSYRYKKLMSYEELELSRNRINLEYGKDFAISGIWSYSLKELCDSGNVGKFLENQINGAFVNITEKFIGVTDCKKLQNLINGEIMEGSNKYLGEQIFSSDMHYIVIDYTDNNQIEKHNTIKLSQNLDGRAVLFAKNGINLNEYEKVFLITAFAIHGIKLLYGKQNLPKKFDKKINYPKVFINLCCESINTKQGEDINEKNATALITLETAYKQFLFIVTGEDNNEKWNKEFFKNHKLNYEIVERKKRANIRNRDIANGYSESEVLTSEGGGNHCLGLVVKSLEDVKKIASEYKNENDTKKLTLEEFVNYINEIGNFNNDAAIAKYL